MKKTIFLNQTAPLAVQVAGVLTSGDSMDLSHTEVWIPTAGAGRRIRQALAGKGVLSPRFVQPMSALRPAGAQVAEKFEREGAWALALEKLDAGFLEPLFSGARLDSEATRLKSGGVLCDLCDLLAEAGLSPADASVGEICSEDAERWAVLARVYQCYLAILKDFDLIDPNEARFQEVRHPGCAGTIHRLVIACIPDLPAVAQSYAEALVGLGVSVEVLVWQPGEMAGGFDAWGRPLPAEWAACRLEVDQIGVARSPADEARHALEFALASPVPGDYALVLADPELGSALRGEIESRGGKAFLPDGNRLDLSEAGTMAIEWLRFQASGDLRVLRRLLELPRFSQCLRTGSELSAADALAVCDYLIGEVVLSDFDQALAFAEVAFDPVQERAKRRQQLAPWVGLVGTMRALAVGELLHQAWMSGGEGLEAAKDVAALHHAISTSPLFENHSTGIGQALARALKSEPVFDASQPGDVELPGWLEAPWLEAGRLALCGCVEGILPSAVNGHAFLPDSKRKALRLADNASRFARDAYLFQCLLLARRGHAFRCSFSRFDAEGSPSMPSRLFLRCEAEALPERVLGLFGKLPPGAARARRENGWKWQLPAESRKRVEKMSPTDFSEYLACPLRFYLKKVLWLDTFTADAREMDAKRFGTLVHEAVEKFGRTTPHEADAARIERFVLEHLEASVLRLFGPLPSPAVRIQIEAARVRLRGFARVQAEQFAKGWRIRSVEKKLSIEDPHPLRLGPLFLSGKIDRIDWNEDTGEWRVLDYKSSPKADPPAKKHFGPKLAAEWLPEAPVTIQSGTRLASKRWKNLQLPLYTRILRHWHGADIGGARVTAAYFTLSADPADTEVKDFSELTGEVLESALECAEQIATRVHKGQFWPPQPLRSSWGDPFESLFVNGKPEHCIHEDTVDFLKGAP